MPTSYKAINKYAKANYDRIAVVVPKGSAEAIKAAAASENKSTNRYILEAIEAKSGLRLAMDSTRSFAAASRGYSQGSENSPQEPPECTQQPAPHDLTPQALKAAQQAAEAEGEAVPDYIERAIITQAERDKAKRALFAPAPRVPSIKDKI